MELTDQAKQTGIKIIHYGDSGSGKSIRSAKFAQFGKVYFFDFDNKIQNVAMYMKENHPELLPNISYDTYLGETAEMVDSVNRKLKEIAAGNSGIKTLVFDSWTQWERAYFNVLMTRFQSLGGKGWGEARQKVLINKDDSITIPGTADHQLKNRAFAEFIDKLVSIPVNVIVNCHIKEVMKGPATVHASGGIANILPTRFNETLYLHKNAQGAFKIRVQGNEDYVANSTRKGVGLTGILEKDDLSFYESVQPK